MFSMLKQVVAFTAFVLLSMLIGSVLGRIAGTSLNSSTQLYHYVSEGYSLYLPLLLDLKVVLIDLKLTLVINALGVLGLILGGILFFRLYL